MEAAAPTASQRPAPRSGSNVSCLTYALTVSIVSPIEASVRDGLEFDHIVPVARGGESTEDNLRLRCRAHNQLEAERTFGAGFMRRKREERRECEALAPELAAKRNDLISGLRTLGYSAAQAKWAAAQCEDRLGLSLEALLKHALTFLAPASARRIEAPAPAA